MILLSFAAVFVFLGVVDPDGGAAVARMACTGQLIDASRPVLCLKIRGSALAVEMLVPEWWVTLSVRCILRGGIFMFT